MLRKEYSVELYNREGKRSKSFNSGSYVVYYGNTPQQTYIEEFPSYARTRADKEEFITSRIMYLQHKREAMNARRREIRKDKIAGTYKPRTRKKKAKKVAEKPQRKYEITVTKKKTRGVFVKRKFIFRHLLLIYKRPILVKVFNKPEFAKLKQAIKEDFIVLTKRAFRYKGERKFIYKLITPFYDYDGNMMYSDDLEEKDDEGNKTGRVDYAPTSYSFGFSIGRTARINSPQRLLTHIDDLLDAWEESLKRKYEGLTSRIELSALMIEELVKESAA